MKIIITDILRANSAVYNNYNLFIGQKAEASHLRDGDKKGYITCYITLDNPFDNVLYGNSSSYITSNGHIDNIKYKDVL